MRYLINYDLNTPGQSYTTLIAAIQSNKNWAKISRSCWIIESDRSAMQIRDDLASHLDRNDLLFVCAISDWASLNFSAEVNTWLSN